MDVTHGHRTKFEELLADISFLEANLAPVLANWPQGIQQLLTRIDAASPNHSAGVSKQLGNWYRGLHRSFGQDRFQWLHDQVAQFVAEHLVLTINDRVSRIPSSFGQIKGWLSVVEAAHVIGVAPERLRQALRDGEVEGEVRRGGSDRDFRFIRREVVEALRHHRARYVDARRAMTILDVTKTQLRRLVDAGGGVSHDASDRPSLVDAPYLNEELVALMDAIGSRHQPWQSGRHGLPVVLGDIKAVRGRVEDYVLRAYRAILRGDVVPREIRDSATGLNRFVFDEDEINFVALPSPHDGRMTLTQLCDMTGWKHESIAKWVVNGFLMAERIPNGSTMTTLIRFDDLVHFSATMWSSRPWPGIVEARVANWPISSRARAVRCTPSTTSRAAGSSVRSSRWKTSAPCCRKSATQTAFAADAS